MSVRSAKPSTERQTLGSNGFSVTGSHGSPRGLRDVRWRERAMRCTLDSSGGCNEMRTGLRSSRSSSAAGVRQLWLSRSGVVGHDWGATVAWYSALMARPRSVRCRRGAQRDVSLQRARHDRRKHTRGDHGPVQHGPGLRGVYGLPGAGHCLQEGDCGAGPGRLAPWTWSMFDSPDPLRLTGARLIAGPAGLWGGSVRGGGIGWCRRAGG